MAIIGSTDFYIGVRSLPKRQFEDYSAHLFDEWEAYVGRELQLPDYSLEGLNNSPKSAIIHPSPNL